MRTRSLKSSQDLDEVGKENLVSGRVCSSEDSFEINVILYIFHVLTYPLFCVRFLEGRRLYFNCSILLFFKWGNLLFVD